MNSLQILMQNLNFKNNNISYYSLLYLNSYSQNITILDTTFDSNTGILILASPIRLTTATDYACLINAKNLKITNNKN